MSDLLNKLGSVLKENPELQSKFEKVESAEEAYGLMKDYLDGASFEDFQEALKEASMKEEGTRELDLDDLNEVSGGKIGGIFLKIGKGMIKGILNEFSS